MNGSLRPSKTGLVATPNGLAASQTVLIASTRPPTSSKTTTTIATATTIGIRVIQKLCSKHRSLVLQKRQYGRSSTNIFFTKLLSIFWNNGKQVRKQSLSNRHHHARHHRHDRYHRQYRPGRYHRHHSYHCHRHRLYGYFGSIVLG